MAPERTTPAAPFSPGELLDALPGPGVVLDAAGVVVARNRAASGIDAGSSVDAILDALDISDATDRAMIVAGVHAVLGGRQRACTVQCAGTDDAARVGIRVTSLGAPAGGAVLQRIAVTAAAPSPQAAAVGTFEALFGAATEPMVLVTDDGAVVSGNGAARALLDCDEVGLLRVHLATFLSAGSGIAPPAAALQALRRDGQWRGAGRLLRQDGLRELDVVATANIVPGRHLVCLRDHTELRAMQAQLRQAQKMEAIGLLAGGMAHDFNNLLTVVLANADLVLESLPPEHGELREEVGQMIQAARRGSDMVRKLLAFSRRDVLERRAVSLEAVLSETIALLARLLPSDITVQHDVTADLPGVMADPGALQHVLLNLATNARDAMPTGGVLTVRGGFDPAHERPDGSIGPMVTLTVEDTGRGMDREVLEHLFEPFFTTKGPGEGTGLGMTMIYGLVQQHEGTVKVQSTVGLGTKITIALPPADLGQRTPTPLSTPAIASPASETILLVEDEEMVRRAGRRILEKHGYRVLQAGDGAEALVVLRERASEIALVVSDVVMPRMGGRELYAALRDEGYRMPFLFTSGYTDRMKTESAALDPSVPVLPKPWTWTELTASVRAAIDAGPPTD